MIIARTSQRRTGALYIYLLAASGMACGGAGTAMRFIVGFLTLGQGRYRIDGNQRMHQRPIGPLLDAMQQRMCAEVMRVAGIAGVFYDLTHKPPGTIEWE